MVRHILKILQQILQDFQSVSNHFTTLRSKGLNFLSTQQIVPGLSAAILLYVEFVEC